MSANKPESRAEFKEYCLRKLGKPVIQINVADEQVEPLIDEALQIYHEEHYDGSMKLFLPFEMTAQVIANRYVEVDPSIIGVHRIMESQIVGSGQFSIQWQLMAMTVPYALSASGLLNYNLAMSFQSTMKEVLGSKYTPIRFNKRSTRLYIDTNWANVTEGMIYVAECMVLVDPNVFPEVWNDCFLKDYCTALIKRQWGNNLRKHQNVQLAGGVTIDGLAIMQEAQAEIDQIREEMLLENSEPVEPFMG